jgi:cbb3-type cytochrome oxidase subunit 3
MLWGLLGGVMLLLLVVVWAITVSDIIRRHLPRGQTAGWLIIVVLLPFLGSVLWWALRKPTPDEVEHQAESEIALREQARRRGFDSTGIGP